MTMCSGEHTERTGGTGRTVESEGQTGDRSRTPRDPHTERRGGKPRNRVRHTAPERRRTAPTEAASGGVSPSHSSRSHRGKHSREERRRIQHARSRTEAFPGSRGPLDRASNSNHYTRHRSRAVGRGCRRIQQRARQRGRPHLSRVRHHSSERGRSAPDDRHRRGHCPRHRRSPTADRPAGRSAAGPTQVRSRPTADPGSCGPPDRA